MTKRVMFRFDCPACGEPWAHPVQDVVDIHAGACYTCAECGAWVEFTVEWVGGPLLTDVVLADGGPDVPMD